MSAQRKKAQTSEQQQKLPNKQNDIDDEEMDFSEDEEG